MRSQESPWQRLAEPGVLVSVIILAVAIIYNSTSGLAIAAVAVRRYVWDALVWSTPSKLLFGLDDWLSPNPFPRPMLLARPATYEAKSEALARLLGLNRPGGIVASVSYAGKSGFSRLSAGKDVDRPSGLGNLSNSCYQNSILQGLASLKPVREYLAWVASEGDRGLPRTYRTEALGKLVSDLYSASENGRTLWTPPILKNMSTFQQQDAQEYFSKLLDGIEEEIQKALSSIQKHPGYESDGSRDDSGTSQHSDDSGYHSVSTVSKYPLERNNAYRIPLEGMVSQRVACMVCGDSSGLRLDPFRCLTLNPSTNTRTDRLERMLDDFTGLETIEDVKCGNCTLIKWRTQLRRMTDDIKRAKGMDDDDLRAGFPDLVTRLEAVETALEEGDLEEATLTEKCKISQNLRVKSTKSKQVGIARAPPSLVFHINRSSYDEYTGRPYKNTTQVGFPKHLDLGPWCVGSARSLSEHAEEQWQLPSEQPMVAGSTRRSNLVGPKYELRAVVTHHGLHENGHYVCYRKHPPPPRKEGGNGAKGKQPVPATLVAEQDIEQDGVENVNEETSMLSPEIPPATPAVEEDREEAHWWRLSDSVVTQSDEERVLSLGEAFMLFYECVDPNSVLASGLEVTGNDEDDGFTDEDVSTAFDTPRMLPSDAAASGGGPDDKLEMTLHDLSDDAALADTTSADRSHQGQKAEPARDREASHQASIVAASGSSIVVQHTGLPRAAVKNEPVAWHARTDVLRQAASVPLPSNED